MEFAQLILQRQSCRNFDPTRDVEPEKLQACLQAAANAPSARNAQPWHFTVASGAQAQRVAKLAQKRNSNPFSLNCPVMIVLSEAPADPREAALRAQGVEVPDFRAEDVGICAAHLVLQATALGLSTCMLGLIDKAALSAALHLDTPIHMVICLGYAAQEDVLREKVRRPLAQSVTFLAAEDFND